MNACFDGDGFDVGQGVFGDLSQEKTRQECDEVMNQYQPKYQPNVLLELIHVFEEGNGHDGYQYYEGKHLDGFFDF